MNRPLALLALLLAAVAMLTLPFLAAGGWGPFGCSVERLAVAQVPPSWKFYPDNPGQAFLIDGQGRTLGGWDFASKVYRPWDGKAFGKSTQAPPIEPPIGPGALPFKPSPRPTANMENFGLDLDKIGPCEAVCYYHRGVPIGREEAWGAVSAGGKLPDDRTKPWLVVIGQEPDRKRYLESFEAKVEPELRAKLRVCSLAPDDYRLRDTSTNEPLYVTTGTPTVYCQAPDGKVLHRQDAFDPKVDDFQEIRKAVGYESKKDPDLRLQAGGSLLLWILVGIAVLWWLARDKEQPSASPSRSSEPW
jgi:hypothetical protein